jgi:hypothetical protein
MKLLLILFLATITLMANSQTYINDYKAVVRSKLKRLIKENNFQRTSIVETDSTMALQVRDTAWKPVDFVYHFTKNKKCHAEEFITRCEPCFQKYLSNALSMKEYEWVKIDDTHYVSSYNKERMIEIIDDQKEFVFIIYKMKWDKERYNKVINP